MNLKESVELLNRYGYIVEDTDELDDADLPVGMDAKEYHKQKAKMQSLEDKVKAALNRQTASNVAKLNETVPPEIKKMAKSLNSIHKRTYKGDYKGSFLMDKDKDVDTELGDKTFEERCMIMFEKGQEMGGTNHTGSVGKIIGKRSDFKKYWIPKAKQLLDGETVKIYRGIHIEISDAKDKRELVLESLKRNMLDRNSWTFNRDVAVDYSALGDISLVAEMECSLADVNLYYSAWLEGYWGIIGSHNAQGGANDEINLKQMLNVQNIKIRYASTKAGFKSSNKIAAKFLGITESAVKGDFVSGEKGGEEFFNLTNNYTKTDALKYFLCGCTNFIKMDSTDEKVIEYAQYRLPKARLAQFNKTYEQFEKYRSGGMIKLYRGLVLTDGSEVDMGKAGECWSFSSKMPIRWVDEIVDWAAAKHILHEDTRKYILTGTTELNNCRLAYSFWLAGRFERPEWEIRVKDESAVVVKSQKEIE